MLAQLGLSRLHLEEPADTPDVDVPVVGGAAGPSTPVGLASGSPAAALELDLHSSPSPSQPEQQPKPPPARRAWDPEPGRQELADQVYAQMLLRETEVRQWVPSGGFWRELLVCRGNVVDWLYEACESLRLEAAVLHLAVHYLDWTMLAVDVPQDEMQTLCMACLLTAAKFHGPEFCVPPLATVVSFARCTEKEICAMELRVLFALDWRTNAVTALQVVDHHLCLGAVVPKDGCGDDTRSAARLVSKLRKVSEFFLLQMLYEHRFLESRATLCGAAALAAARETLGLESWPVLLEQRSGYTRATVVSLGEDVLEQAHSRFPEEFYRDAAGCWVAAGVQRHDATLQQGRDPDAAAAAAAPKYSPPASPLADFDKSMIGADS
jgi:hypothetical protein